MSFYAQDSFGAGARGSLRALYCGCGTKTFAAVKLGREVKGEEKDKRVNLVGHVASLSDCERVSLYTCRGTYEDRSKGESSSKLCK